MKKDCLHVNLTPQLIQKAQTKWDLICKEGSTKCGVNDEIDTTVKPDWYDEQRFLRGQSYICDYYAALINSMSMGLLVFLQLPIELNALMGTGKSKNLAKLFIRYLNTMQYVDEWYHSDLFDPKSKSYKSLSSVHWMHKNSFKILNKKMSVCEFATQILKENNLNFNDEDIKKYIRSKNRVWISQFDMVLIQWAFLGCCILEPEASGMHGITIEQMQDIIYVWKVISYKLGIDPKYSLVESVDFDFVYAMCKLILEQEYLVHMENVCAPAGLRMGEGVLFTLKSVIIGANFNVLIRYWYKILNVNSYKINRSKYEHNTIQLLKLTKKNQITDEERESMLKNGFNDKYIVFDCDTPFEKFQLNGFKERMLYKYYVILIRKVLKYKWGRKFANNMIRNAMFKVLRIKKQKLKKYEEIENERFKFTQCPFLSRQLENEE